MTTLTMYKPRTYRSWVKEGALVSFEVIEKETDLFISASQELKDKARESILNYRKEIEDYIKREPRFRVTLEPLEAKVGAPRIVKAMCEAGKKAGVGPMAAVAGAIAEFVGRDLLMSCDEVIVENGGDIFMRSLTSKKMGVYAGEKSPFTGKLAIEIEPSPDGIGVCTSSGTVSHSLSFGKADAALIISKWPALADAMATAVGNRVKGPADIEKAVEFAKSIKDVSGVLILIGDKMGSWGSVKLA